jgi:hypothetical protein
LVAAVWATKNAGSQLLSLRPLALPINLLCGRTDAPSPLSQIHAPSLDQSCPCCGLLQQPAPLLCDSLSTRPSLTCRPAARRRVAAADRNAHHAGAPARSSSPLAGPHRVALRLSHRVWIGTGQAPGEFYAFPVKALSQRPLAVPVFVAAAPAGTPRLRLQTPRRETRWNQGDSLEEANGQQ